MKAIIFILLTTNILIAQVNQVNQLDINNVKANIIPNADFIGNSTGSGLPYQTPKNGNIPSVTKAALWIGGYVNQQLRTAAMTYRQNGQDFWPGPLDTANVTIDQNTSNTWDKSWRVNVFEIDSFISNYANGNVANGSYIIPQNIATWPGNGDALLNQSTQLAPYVDVNNDGIYNPANGDYPKIKGDQAIWFVFNDVLGNHLESGSINKIGLEVHAMAYAYFCPTIHDSDQAINNTTFYEFKIFNRSTNILDSTNIGIWIDSDLGYYNDDYVGCNVENNFAYIYNGDNFDQSAFGLNGYGNNHAFQAYQILKGPSADFVNATDDDNDGCVDCTFGQQYSCDTLNGVISEMILREEIKLSHFTPLINTGDILNGNPSSSGNGLQFYNLLNGYWKNGTLMRYDGIDGKSGNGQPCHYIYPGTSDPSGFGLGGNTQAPITMPNWSEVSAGNIPGDRKMLLSMGQFTFMPQTSKTLEFAIITSRLDNTSGNNLDFTNMNNDTRKIREWYACNNFPSCVGSSSLGMNSNIEPQNVSIYPNPASSELTIEFDKNENTKREISITNILGSEIIKQVSSEIKLTFNINQLNSGIYTVKVLEGGKIKIMRFVKN